MRNCENRSTVSCLFRGFSSLLFVLFGSLSASSCVLEGEANLILSNELGTAGQRESAKEKKKWFHDFSFAIGELLFFHKLTVQAIAARV